MVNNVIITNPINHIIERKIPKKSQGYIYLKKRYTYRLTTDFFVETTNGNNPFEPLPAAGFSAVIAVSVTVTVIILLLAAAVVLIVIM